MTNIQKLENAIVEARKGRFLMYDNPEDANKKIVIDTDSNILNIVIVKNKKICSCSCNGGVVPCKHMIKVSMKYGLDICLSFEQTVTKKSTAKKITTKSKVIKISNK